MRKKATTASTTIGMAAAISATQPLTCSFTERSARVTIAHNLPVGSSPFTLKDSRGRSALRQFTSESLSRYGIEMKTGFVKATIVSIVVSVGSGRRTSSRTQSVCRGMLCQLTLARPLDGTVCS